MAGTPKNVALSRELLLTLYDAQIEASAAIGLRGQDARHAMRRERERQSEMRWRDVMKHARKTEWRRATEDDYRSTVPADESGDAARIDESGRDSLDTVDSGATSGGAVASSESSGAEEAEAPTSSDE